MQIDTEGDEDGDVPSYSPQEPTEDTYAPPPQPKQFEPFKLKKQDPPAPPPPHSQRPPPGQGQAHVQHQPVAGPAPAHPPPVAAPVQQQQLPPPTPVTALPPPPPPPIEPDLPLHMEYTHLAPSASAQAHQPQPQLQPPTPLGPAPAPAGPSPTPANTLAPPRPSKRPPSRSPAASRTPSPRRRPSSPTRKSPARKRLRGRSPTPPAASSAPASAPRRRSSNRSSRRMSKGKGGSRAVSRSRSRSRSRTPRSPVSRRSSRSPVKGSRRASGRAAMSRSRSRSRSVRNKSRSKTRSRSRSLSRDRVDIVGTQYLWVGEVQHGVTAAEVESALSDYGRVRDIREIPNRFPRPIKAFFVTMETREGGARVLKGKVVVRGRVVVVNVNKKFETGREFDRRGSRSPTPPPTGLPARSPTPADDGPTGPRDRSDGPPFRGNKPVKIDLGHLPQDITVDDLRTEFGRHVDVLDAWRDEYGRARVIVANWEGGMNARREIQARELLGPRTSIYVNKAALNGNGWGGGRGRGDARRFDLREDRHDGPNSLRDRDTNMSPAGSQPRRNDSRSRSRSPQTGRGDFESNKRFPPVTGQDRRDYGGARSGYNDEDEANACPTLYVSFFPADISRHAIWDVFERFGTVDYVRLVQSRKAADLVHAFVTFDSLDAAKEARREMNGMRLFGMRLPVRVSYGRGIRVTDRNPDDPAVLTREARKKYLEDSRSNEEAEKAVGQQRGAQVQNSLPREVRTTDESFETAGKEEKTRILHVWSLPPDITPRDFLSFMDPASLAALVKYKFRVSRNPENSQSHAYAVFRDRASARHAMEFLSGRMYGASETRCGYAVCTSSKVRCSGLPQAMGKRSNLMEEFRKFGSVEGVVVDEQRGEAVVDFEESDDAKNAVVEIGRRGEFQVRIVDDFTQMDLEDRLGNGSNSRSQDRGRMDVRDSNGYQDRMEVDIPPAVKSVYDLPLVFQGSLSLKNRDTQIDLHHVAGNKTLFNMLNPAQPIKLVQRFRFNDQTKSDLIVKMRVTTEGEPISPSWTVGLAVARGSKDKTARSFDVDSLKYISDYFKEKECAGVTQENIPGVNGHVIALSWMPNIEDAIDVVRDAYRGNFRDLAELSGTRDNVGSFVVVFASVQVGQAQPA
ncbi:hypothetical protein M427DRAFT_60556 [Gonapodya prolifera JEL478]|uniref:RNA-binding domain-containing protein n=1 Tax=Gonapodya prolifera (strain JEL478) TaxID=1344416 RepID=A0A139A581_GONPJ|nr:hypothetical protein M427DRAFT_60556 [Gonapodya prolifera JEL478]|eukprot:KXS11543.1 hypothetical protein M427DRAFT_60556 [Gonapodya prolifera JEL478]